MNEINEIDTYNRDSKIIERSKASLEYINI